jgi:hypothetical protein
MSEEEKREAFSTSSKNATKKDWGTAPTAPAGLATPGQPAGAPVAKIGADGKPIAGAGDPKAKAKGQRKGGGFMSKLDAAAKEKMTTGSPEEKRKILEDAGVPPERIDTILENMSNGRGFGGGGRGDFGGPGGGGGGFGGPPGGGGGPGQ